MPELVRPDVTLNYQLVGPPLEDGQTPVVLIHGLGANLAFWYLGAVRHLGREMPMLLPDLRGHGGSSMPETGYGLEALARDVLALMDETGLSRVHLVGHSHGARVALVVAMMAPDRVASLTVADTQVGTLQPPMRLCDWAHWPVWRKQLEEQGVETFPPDDSEIDFRLLSDLGARGQAALATGGVSARVEGRAAGRPRKRAGINLRSRQMGARGAEKWRGLLERTSARQEMDDEAPLAPEKLAALEMPLLLVYGAQSHCLPTSEALMELVPGARRIVVPGAGHFFPIVKPRLFALALRAFIAGVERPGAAAERRTRARAHQRPILRAALRRRRSQ
ncbi:Pimeloyl-ACP methyl ester carboxylesterase [Roseivivax halotolerans]|uniref:Pimeloyl-ACP methyl ester carboxylesterase n=1 Tax=Roseivivax halotolerans TaxID=93684 RepID=A0A1I5WLE6_9RHOB|nr:alpha/beta hydrolase [Roseivivax halotolerans]SFQ20662.1 Pimeloyl-ACP methyl ester carboxylesterase [Roseivivax halotolerans]